MKLYAVTTYVQVDDEALLIQCARDQFERDAGEGTGEKEITSVQDALIELVHLGDPFHPHGPRPALCCGAEIIDYDVRETRR